ncbi:hypothetical protein Pcinc_032437 [Petrolisthes cinctipes]|uniref:Uncharacterized protein n=1 Tax=Petrolisthes cinctipes TaxID=88211 RepID=A0AAE1EUF8_PETCI|nr:hypothetical protein Pcinc_032437 [Petrolisthes cinctipes]
MDEAEIFKISVKDKVLHVPHVPCSGGLSRQREGGCGRRTEDPQAASSFSGELDSVRVGSHRSAPPVPALLPSLASHPLRNPNPGTHW